MSSFPELEELDHHGELVVELVAGLSSKRSYLRCFEDLKLYSVVHSVEVVVAEHDYLCSPLQQLACSLRCMT